MKTSNFLTLIIASFILASCGGDGATSNAASPDPLKLAEKRIKQRIEADALGMIDELEILEVRAGENDSTFYATHSFMNPMISKKVKLSRIYTLNAGLDSVIERVSDGPMYMMSEGEWVKTGW
jgi:PBP1b-binding outer membrane lipoprotein LpoB|tara:strand:- start:217 stop:585 length:369 start_codon:yes stop_codon:yes gene_type:complete